MKLSLGRMVYFDGCSVVLFLHIPIDGLGFASNHVGLKLLQLLLTSLPSKEE